MRLIDADALGVGLCSRDVLPADYCAGWNGLIRLLEKAPTVDAVPVVHGRWVMSSDRPDTIICTCCDSTFELGTDEMGVQMIDLGSADEELQKHIRQFLQLVAGFMGWYGHGE